MWKDMYVYEDVLDAGVNVVAPMKRSGFYILES